jgi:hypothetical protein
VQAFRPATTFQKIAAVTTPRTWLVTAAPTIAIDPMFGDADPTSVQLEPSVDTESVIVDPLRTSPSHTGARFVLVRISRRW